MQSKKVSVCYVGTVFPHDPRFFWSGFSHAGNLAELGIVEALRSSGVGLDKVIAFRPVGNFPRDKIIFAKGYRQKLFDGVRADVFPLFNVFPIRNILRMFFLSLSLLKWSLLKRCCSRVVVVYNIFFPNLFFLRLITWILRIRVVPIIFDWGKLIGWHYDWKTRLAHPKWLEDAAVSAIAKSDGLICITDAIANDGAPGHHYLRVDGGVTWQIVEKLFPLDRKEDTEDFVLFFAGNIALWNHTQVLLDYMKINRDPHLKLWFAGKGADVDLVKRAQQDDPRICFKGMLLHEDLFKLYEQSDVLVNLRDTADPALAHHFPSKQLELLITGRPVICTNPSHTKEVYGEYCYVIDVCSVEQFGKGVEYFRRMSRRERESYGKRAREFMLKEHTWAAQGVRMREYIEKKVV